MHFRTVQVLQEKGRGDACWQKEGSCSRDDLLRCDAPELIVLPEGHGNSA